MPYRIMWYENQQLTLKTFRKPVLEHKVKKKKKGNTLEKNKIITIHFIIIPFLLLFTHHYTYTDYIYNLPQRCKIYELLPTFGF